MPDDTDAEVVIRALAEVGVDFSIPKSALVDFLGNAEFTPYPAMSAALLRTLDSRKLKRPVFLDVIVFNYEHSPGEPSPRRIEDVDTDTLEAAVLEGFNNRYAQQESAFSGLLKPLDVPQPPVQPPQTLAMAAEGTVRTQEGVTLVDTDNPRVEVTARLITVNSEAAHAMVPQELLRQNNGWRFTNGDVRLSVSNGEADAGPRPVRAGSLSDGALAWPTVDGTFSGATGAEVRLQSRIRVGYRPVDVKLLIEGPKGFAANSAAQGHIALDPEVLLVPVEVARFFSDAVPVSNISMTGQMALWDQVPVINETTNFRSLDGSTGELRLAERKWDVWPVLDGEGLYTHLGWVSPDSIWGRAKIRFRLVNYIDIKTDNVHAAPVAGEGKDDRRLRENDDTLSAHPQHISDKRVVKVIFMHRIAPPDAPQIGQALIGTGCVGIAAGASDKFADIAHEIGHLITGSQTHTDNITQPDNVMNDPGPGTTITDTQVGQAREWAKSFADFWAH
ncbi:hypothetical protein ACFY93_05555 [Streptomyces sp. NPDC008313]|uniref:hypothetical protein n=1 Tax=Streptomyces sp. NPDC008313 TaxID=3364826 RepID=UPI0036F178C0